MVFALVRAPLRRRAAFMCRLAVETYVEYRKFSVAKWRIALDNT
jgi:hypothetical protein